MDPFIMLNFPILRLLQDCDDPPLTPESLEDLEIELGVRFPKDYAEFLLHFNGGRFYRSVCFAIPYPTPYLELIRVTDFLGDPNDGIETYGLRSCAEYVCDRIPDTYRSIASCNLSDRVLINFSGPEKEIDGVWFWDSGALIDEGDPELFRIAESFTDFLSMLDFEVEIDEEEKETRPLFQAIESGNLTAIERYLRQGGSPDVRNERGVPLLTAAVDYKWPQIARLLLEHAADPDIRDNEGRTPLHYAASSSIDCLKALLASGANPKVRDNAGRGALGSGWSYRADKILIAHGAE